MERLPVTPADVVIVTDTRTFADAPQELVPYVVPAAWVLAGLAHRSWFDRLTTLSKPREAGRVEGSARSPSTYLSGRSRCK